MRMPDPQEMSGGIKGACAPFERSGPEPSRPAEGFFFSGPNFNGVHHDPVFIEAMSIKEALRPRKMRWSFLRPTLRTCATCSCRTRYLFGLDSANTAFGTMAPTQSHRVLARLSRRTRFTLDAWVVP